MLTDLDQLGGCPVIVQLTDAGLPRRSFWRWAPTTDPELCRHPRAACALPARLRRAGRTGLLRRGPCCIDLVRHVFSHDGRPVHLSPMELALLALRLRRPGRLVERSEMLKIVWGFGHTGDLKTVDVHVKRLRGRLEPVPSRPRHLLTVRGHGYRLAA